ncbi:LysR family transcriptional regulator [Mesocricetibacter intestinalis]|uniref:LysR family transcriptional regulator n=1 Tax=Mesocricetibacter intestinalis TaxID=1521930 RepID=UPI00105FCBDB|nr:LysR family transcriptional regulator [Mesocricetibacter intestinalis]
MDKLQALKIFCSLAETLQFRETASRLAISPQVVSRIIAELEQSLGDSLFQRNTRQVQLSDFGRQILPNAKQIILASEQLFEQKTAVQDIAGIVRISVPDAPLMHKLLPPLLQKLQAYPNLQLDWRMEMKLVDKVGERIDLGIRMGSAPSDSSLIVKKAAQFHEKIVASPLLLSRFGMPRDLQDLAQNYPLAAFIHESFGRYWAWGWTNNIFYSRTIPTLPVITCTATYLPP